MSTLCSKCGLACGDAEYVVHVANNCQTVKCPDCPQFYNNAEALLRHIRAVHGKEFQCSICHIDYASKYNLKRHLAITHKQIDNEKTKCEQCGEVFVGKYFLKRHIQHVHNKEFVCTICETEYSSIYTLRRHTLRRHRNGQIENNEKNKVARIDCPKCGKPIAKSSLERHFRIKHSKSFTCHVCERECRSEKSLQKHIDFRHAEEKSVEALLKKKYKCPQCPRRFASGWTLKTHIRGTHELQFKCELCDKILSAPLPLIKHKLRVHGIKIENETVEPNNDKKFKCSQCPQRFTTSWTLKNHIKGLHEQKFKCELCDKLFSSPASLIRHKINVHGQEDGKEAAEKNFEKQQEDLLKKKYKCPQCSLRFTASWTLKNHIKGKHEEQFKCEVCDKSFSAPFPLIRHKMNVHGLKVDSETNELKCKEESKGNVEEPSPSTEIKTEYEDQNPTID